jgi:chromate reductase
LAAYKNKVAVLMAASPGGLGGLRGLVHVRAILQNIGVIVLPDQRAVSGASSAFDDSGQLKDKKLRQSVQALGTKLANVLSRLGDN